jgi:hypothetical protein
MCAAGLGPKKLRIVCVDPDRSNGNLKRTLQLVSLYRTIAEIASGDSGLFCSTIDVLEPAVWSPFSEDGGSPTLENYFGYQAFKVGEPQIAALFDMLYPPEQKKAKLDIGFRGKPSIGAGIFATKVSLRHEEPWHTLRTSIENDAGSGQRVSLFAVGSIFGGTGAAGLPTIPQLIVEDLNSGQERIAVGAALLLPYFTFNPSKELHEGEVYAHSETFLLNAKEALRYYESNNRTYNRLYLIGVDQPAINQRFSIGGDTQENPPHVVDFLAGLAALDFMSHGTPDQAQVLMTARREAASYSWEDVPNQDLVRPAVRRLTRFCFAFLRMFYPCLKKVAQGDKAARRAPWYVGLLQTQRAGLSDPKVAKALEQLSEFCRLYLTWLGQLSRDSGSDGAFNVRLANCGAFPDPNEPGSFREDRFTTMMLEPDLNSCSLNEVWARACDFGEARSVSGASLLAHFVQSLHRACE